MIREYLRRDAVFLLSSGLILIFILAGIARPDLLDATSSAVHAMILDNFSWLYLISVFFFLVFALALALSRYGSIKLGHDAEKPQYGFFGWVAMLFAAGMGIGLLFWGVSEPLVHYLQPPPFIAAASPDAAAFAMRYAFFHWGVHPWAIYAIVSLSIAYFSFRRGMPALISSCFYPVLGDRIYGLAGNLVDVLAVFATVFGTATSLGFGALQIHSGLSHLYGISSAISVTIGIIIIATALFMASAILGVEKGIQVLSKFNIALAVVLLLLILVLGSAPYVLNVFTSALGGYINNVIDMSLQSYPFAGFEWSRDWTVFYWAWWISWAPFVGLFIARISRGRTIREFVLTVLTVPSLFTFIWFSVFGGSALHLELEQGADIAAVAGEDISLALFLFLEHYPFAGVLSLVAISLLIIFFVTSADSATVVLGSLTSGGGLFVPNYKKVVWGLSLSAVAIVLLVTGGLASLQVMAITVAFPFMLVMLILCYTLVIGLSQE
ncbi:MAG: BCCT family transporter [Methanomicrobiales archaeon]|nr:BCCT family transporter [Methanomicrobiales archaeon]